MLELSASDRLECAQLPLSAIHQEARVELDGLSGVHHSNLIKLDPE